MSLNDQLKTLGAAASSAASRTIARRTAISNRFAEVAIETASRLSLDLHAGSTPYGNRSQGRRPASIGIARAHPSPSGKEWRSTTDRNASFSETRGRELTAILRACARCPRVFTSLFNPSRMLAIICDEQNAQRARQPWHAAQQRLAPTVVRPRRKGNAKQVPSQSRHTVCAHCF